MEERIACLLLGGKQIELMICVMSGVTIIYNSHGTLASEFVCKRCQKVLEIDPSFIENLSDLESLDKELKDSISSSEDGLGESSLAGGTSTSPSSSASPLPKEGEGNSRTFFSSATGFPLKRPGGGASSMGTASIGALSLSNGGKPRSGKKSVHDSGRYKSNIALISNVFTRASDITDMDHPLCSECVEIAIERLVSEFQKAEEENEAYERFIEQWKAEEEEEDTVEDINAEIEKLKEEEKALLKELEEAESMERDLEGQLAETQRDEEELRMMEAAYWDKLNDHEQEVFTFHEDEDAIGRKTEHTRDMLEKLKKTNVYNDAFHIWHDGHFGTINGFRLGRLPSQQVGWDEINAAWGQATLLLYTMARNVNFRFKLYRLLPMGSNSKVEKVDDGSKYELYSSNDSLIGIKYLWFRRYDMAMAGFLVCLNELGNYAESQDSHFRLPHRILRDKVGDLSIKITMNSEATWTKALKFMLTNLKWLLAWMARREVSDLSARQRMRKEKYTATGSKPARDV